MENYFNTLYQVNVSGKVESKNGFSYLSWAYAWAEVKKRFPDALYTVYEAENGCNYHTDGRTCWVKTGVTVNGIEHLDYLPVMDFRNRSIPLDKVTSMDVTKAIQRSLTKCCARHGLGLYVYAGEDLPEEESNTLKCSDCGQLIKSASGRAVEQIVNGTLKNYGRKLCWNCMAKEINKRKEAAKNAAS